MNLSEKELRAKLVSEKVLIVPYQLAWTTWFEEEKARLESILPPAFRRRIEHFGSTSIPGMSGKPIVDILVEVDSLAKTREVVVPLMTRLDYEYLWRPTYGEDGPPWYCWFIRRDNLGNRSHHIHMVEKSFLEHWNRLHFRDYLIRHPEAAAEYEALKRNAATETSGDRLLYSQMKTDWILATTAKAIDE